MVYGVPFFTYSVSAYTIYAGLPTLFYFVVWILPKKIFIHQICVPDIIQGIITLLFSRPIRWIIHMYF